METTVSSKVEALVREIPSYGITGPPARFSDRSGSMVGRRLIQLDFLRGIAILAVIGYHALTVPTKVPLFRTIDNIFKRCGWTGVDLFFVLSGFLIGGLLMGEYVSRGSIRVGRFISRRGFKIWPAYYSYLLFQILTKRFPLTTFLVPNFLHIQNYLGTSLSHTWTLAVEEHFYLVLPFLLVFITKSPQRQKQILPILATICLLTLLLRSWMVMFLGSVRVWEYTHTRLDSLMFGVILSCIYQLHRGHFDRLLKMRGALALGAIVGLAFIYLVPDRSKLILTIGYTINFLSYGCLLLLVLGNGKKITANWAYRGMAWIGFYSYSIYLWHVSVRKPLTSVAMRLHPSPIVWPTLYLAQFCCAIALGVIMAKLVEWPSLRLREKIIPASG